MTLTIPTQTLYGRSFNLSNNKTAVIFHPHNIKKIPPPPSFIPLIIRYALTIRGNERPFLPSFILDDWGQEITKLKLYKWLQLEGDRFPRAEIFGYVYNFSDQWEENQFFARDLELSARHATYLYPDKTAPIPSGRPIHYLLLPHNQITTPQPLKETSFKVPLSRARVQWWQIPTDTALQTKPDLSSFLF